MSQYHNGVHYDPDVARETDTDDNSTVLGIHISEDAWDERYFTISEDQCWKGGPRSPYELETGQIVGVYESESEKYYKCPYRVTVTEETEDTFRIVLKSCRRSTENIVVGSDPDRSSKDSYMWYKGSNIFGSRYAFSISPVYDDVLVEELDATTAYLAGAI